MAILRRTLFGNPILREKSQQLSRHEIMSDKIQQLISNMRTSLEKRKYGVGLAAPQVGKSVSITVIGIKPTPNRPDSKTVDMVMINPEIIETYGKRTGMWEGCISLGSGPDSPYAKALRYTKLKVKFMDENAVDHQKVFDGLLAHVVQHEIDHLNGILFVDRITDSKTIITQSEYRKRIIKRGNKKAKAKS